MESHERIVILLPHPDDEVFCLHILQYFQEYLFLFIYLTNGSPTNELKSAQVREIESQRAIELISTRAEIFNYGIIMGLADGKLARQFSKDDLKSLNNIIGQGLKPFAFISPILEGGHQDHDAAFIITENLCRSWGAEHYTFPLYSSSHLPFPFFHTMKRSQGSIQFRLTFASRQNLVRLTLRLIKIYKSQKRTWLGLTFPVLFHYALSTPIYFINQARRVEHINKFLYESRGHETRDTLKQFQDEFTPEA